MNALDHHKEIVSQDEDNLEDIQGETDSEQNNNSEDISPMVDRRKTILDRWVEKFKEFLDNA
jgi:hypothetical protein